MNYPLEKRCKDILDLILHSDGPVSVSLIMEKFGISRRTAYYDLDRIDEWLNANGFSYLSRDRAKGIRISRSETSAIQELLLQENAVKILTPLERERLIICILIICSRPVFSEDLMNWCTVSRNTTVNDIKNVGQFLKKNKLILKYLPKEGYVILGDPIRSRALFCLYYPQFAGFFNRYIYADSQKTVIESFYLRLKNVEKRLDAEFITGTLATLAVLTASLRNQTKVTQRQNLKSGNSLNIPNKDVEQIRQTREYELVSNQFEELNENERLYLSLQLLGSRLQEVPVLTEESSSKAADFAKKLTKSFEEITGISCSSNQELLNALTAHIRTAYYRYRYGIQVGNPMLEDIIRQYRELFELTKAAFLRIGDETGFHVSDAEIAYLTLHFGTVMNTRSPEQRGIRIMVICPNGIGASNMIRQEVLRLIPSAEEISICPFSKYSPDNNSDVILSTVSIPNEKKLILVNPVLSDLDRVSILRKCMNFQPLPKARKDDILTIAEKYIPIGQFPAFAQEISEYFSGLGPNEVTDIDYGAGLLQYLTPSHIQFIEGTCGWEEAIKISCQPLLMADSITENYIDAIIHAQKEEKHYMFLSEGLVLAHSSTVNGVKKIDVAISVFPQTVIFGNRKPAGVIVALAAEDETHHIQILNDILNVFSEHLAYQKMMSSRSASDIRQCIEKCLKDK